MIQLRLMVNIRVKVKVRVRVSCMTQCNVKSETTFHVENNTILAKINRNNYQTLHI